MKIEVGYLPKNYFSTDPNAGGFFPFAMNEVPQFIFLLDGIYLPRSNNNFFTSWMKKINGFPMYFCTEVYSHRKKFFVEEHNEWLIDYEYLSVYKEKSIVVSKIENSEQFSKIFPLFISMGSENCLVLWSTKKNIFQLEERIWKGNWEGKRRESVVTKFDENISLFWISYDGNGIVGLSNNHLYSTLENIENHLPSSINISFTDFS